MHYFHVIRQILIQMTEYFLRTKKNKQQANRNKKHRPRQNYAKVVRVMRYSWRLGRNENGFFATSEFPFNLAHALIHFTKHPVRCTFFYKGFFTIVFGASLSFCVSQKKRRYCIQKLCKNNKNGLSIISRMYIQG